MVDRLERHSRKGLVQVELDCFVEIGSPERELLLCQSAVPDHSELSPVHMVLPGHEHRELNQLVSRSIANRHWLFANAENLQIDTVEVLFGHLEGLGAIDVPDAVR